MLGGRADVVEPGERGGEVVDARREEVHAEIAALATDVGQEMVVGKARVKLGEEVDRRADARAVAGRTHQSGVAEVVVDVPDPAPGALGGDGGERRPGGAEADRGQPLLGDERVAAGDGGLEALDDEAALAGGGAQGDAEDARLDSALSENERGGADEVAQRLAQLVEAGLAGAGEEVLERLSHARWPGVVRGRCRSSLRAGRRRRCARPRSAA